MTNTQAAIADGFAALKEEHGLTYARPSDSAEFVGVAGLLRPDSPLLVGSQDRIFPISMLPTDEPSAPLRAGDELTQGSSFFRVSRRDYDNASGLVVVMVVPY